MEKNECDVLIRNGLVVTMDSGRRIYRCGTVAVSGRRIVGVGTDTEMAERFESRETIDAGAA